MALGYCETEHCNIFRVKLHFIADSLKMLYIVMCYINKLDLECKNPKF